MPDALRPGGALDRYIAELVKDDLFSGTVLLTHRKRTVLSRSYGMADEARRIPNRPDTVFALGSITKLFTGVAIGQLAAQGKVAYEGKVGEYLDGFAPEVADNVTIHHLLTHTSGLSDFHSDKYFEAAREWDSEQEFFDGTMSFVRKCALDFKPGAGEAYSNAGYMILGAIVAVLSKKGSYYDYVRDNIFRRARMESTGFYTIDQWRKSRRMAHPYNILPSGEREDTIDDKLYVGSPAGGAFASAPDMIRFAHAFQDGTLLDSNHAHVLTSPKLPKGADQTTIYFQGYSLWAHLVNGHWVNGHNGGSTGVSCHIDWLPASGWAISILANYGIEGDPLGPAAWVASQARQLITKN